MENNYEVTKHDILAKFICFDRGIVCEAVPSGENGVFKVGIHKNDELIKIRDVEFQYDEQDYAIYESYRALSQILLQDGNG